LEDTYFGIYTSDIELMDTSNTSGRDLKCTVLLSSENFFLYYFKLSIGRDKKKKKIERENCEQQVSMNSRISGLAHQQKVC
jgi:hypothetical protein